MRPLTDNRVSGEGILSLFFFLLVVYVQIQSTSGLLLVAEKVRLH